MSEKEKTSKKVHGNSKAYVVNSFCKRTFIEVFCKKCKQRYSNTNDYEAVFQNKADAIESLQDSGWFVVGVNAFCKNCL